MGRRVIAKKLLGWMLVLILALSMNSAVFAESAAHPADAGVDGPIEVWKGYATGPVYNEENKLGSYNSLKEALDAASNSGESIKIVYVREDYTLTEDVEIPSGVKLAVYGRADGQGYKGAALTVPAGRTLTVKEGCDRLDIFWGCTLKVQSGGTVLLEGGTYSQKGCVYLAPQNGDKGKGTLQGTLSVPAGKELFRWRQYYWSDIKDKAIAQITTGEGQTTYCDNSSNIAPENGETLTLLTDVTASQTISSGDVVIDLNGHTWTGKTDRSNKTLAIKFSSTGTPIKAVIKNGTVVAGNGSGQAIDVSGTDLTIASNAVIDGKQTYGIVVGTNAKVTVEGTVKSTKESAISGNGINNNNTEITVKAPAKIFSEETTAIYHPQIGILRIEGGQITGNTGVELRSGTLNMSGGTITGGDTFQYMDNENGGTTEGAGIAVVQHVTKNPINVTISGGTVSGSRAFYEKNPNSPETDDAIKLSITGGSFNKTGGEQDAVSVYSEKKKDFITGGTYNTMLDLAYYDETKYIQYKLDDKKLPGTVAPYSFEPEVAVETPNVSQGAAANISEETAKAAAENAKEAVKAVLEGKRPAGISEEAAEKIQDLLKDLTSRDEVSVTISIRAEKQKAENVSEAEQSLIQALASGDEKAAAYFDFSVVMKVQLTKNGGATAEVKEISLSSVESPLLFEIHVDPSLIQDRSVRIGRVHDGKAETLLADEIDRENGIIRVSADKFSTYALLTSETVTVNFDTMGGTAVKSQTVKYHARITRPEDPVRDGYTFGGWYTEKACKTAYDFNTQVEAPFTLYAKWVKDEAAANDKTTGQDGTHNGAPGQGKGDAAPQAVRTGDDTNMAGWFAAMILAAAAAVVLLMRNRKKS